MKLLKITGFVFLGLLIIVMLIPQITYLYYISKIEKPVPPEKITISEEDALNLWEKYEKNREIKVERLNPYSIFPPLFQYAAYGVREKTPKGFKVTNMIAKKHCQKLRSVFSWHYCRMSTGIWLSRNWNEKQILESMMEIENREVNRKYNLFKIIDLMYSPVSLPQCKICFNEEHLFLFDFINNYKAEQFDIISENNKKLLNKRIVLELDEEFKNKNNYLHGEIIKKFIEEHGSFFELYVKTILEYAKQNIDGLNSYALLFSVVDGWYSEELEERLYQFVKNNPEHIVKNIDKIKESIKLVSFDTTLFYKDDVLRKKLLGLCEKYNSCREVELLYK